MSLAYAIHQRWAANTALNTLLPATRLFTGRAPKVGGNPQPLPYCTLIVPNTDIKVTTNVAIHRAYSTRFKFWVINTALGEQIEWALEKCFENWSTELAGGYGTLREFAPGPCQRQEEEGPAEARYWQFISEYTAYIDYDRRST